MDFGKSKSNTSVKNETRAESTTRGRSKSCNARTSYENFNDIFIQPSLKRENKSFTEKPVQVKAKCKESSNKNYSIQLRPGSYQLSVNRPCKESPICITLSPDKVSVDEPPKEQQPLLYDEPSSPSSFPRRFVNKLFHSHQCNPAHGGYHHFGVRRKRHEGCWDSQKNICQRKTKFRVAERKKSEGNELYKNKQYREALRLYSEAIELCPECASYYSNRSACHMMMGRYAQALSDAREAVRLDASFVKGYIRVAKCNIALGEANAALSVLRRATELEPASKSVLEEIERATGLLRYAEEVEKAASKRDYRAAIYHLDRAIELATGCRNLKNTKAEYLVYLGRYSEAQEIVNEILQFESGNVDAIYVRGMCLYYEDNQDAAFTHFQHVLRLAPDHKKAKEIYKKAKVLKQKKEEGNQAFKKGSYREALSLYTEALAIDVNNKNTNSKLYCNRATVNAKLGKMEDAISDCTAAINLNEDYVKAYMRRAKCYQEVEKHEDAVRDYEKVCRLDRNQEHKRLLQDAKVQLKCSKRKDYYKILGVSRTASDEDIKKSYKKMALQHHPDRHANASEKEKQEHEIKFKEIGEAYAVLTDSKKRALFDRGQDVNNPDCGFSEWVDPNQIFQDFFGGQSGGSFSFGHQGGNPGGPFSYGSSYSSGYPGSFHFEFC